MCRRSVWMEPRPSRFRPIARSCALRRIPTRTKRPARMATFSPCRSAAPRAEAHHAQIPADDWGPVYSPDGKWIAYRAQFLAGYESDRWRLMLYDRASGERLPTSPKTSIATSNSPHWSADSKTIYFQTEEKAELPIYSIAATAGSTPKAVLARQRRITISTSAATAAPGASRARTTGDARRSFRREFRRHAKSARSRTPMARCSHSSISAPSSHSGSKARKKRRWKDCCFGRRISIRRRNIRCCC